MSACFGPALSETGVTFRLFAPAAREVSLLLHGEARPMTREADGWYRRHEPAEGAGTRYRFRIDDELVIPDPASRFQPDDIAGDSEVIDPHYDWRHRDWKGRPWHEAVFVELHVGTFTPQGNYRGVMDRLDHLAATGFTAIELMPLADFPGRWNWGYDGVLPFAPDSRYGRPEELKALIDTAHGRGLMVFLDVVYNHFGPEGNYLPRLAPQFFSARQTPWGGAVDYSRPEVRRFAVENALSWLRDYRFDGLRLDAVHAIVSPGTPSILHDMGVAAGELAARTGRHIHLVLENDDNGASLLAPDEEPPRGRYRAQWNDDFHHAAHVLLTGERQGYYKDYEAPGARLARCLAEGFAYQGDASHHRNGEPRGEPSAALPPRAFVNFLQNHDQIGNRARGERLSVLARPQALEAMLAILLLAPSPPLLFMGEEWGASEPFPFFCDFHGDLAVAVREGRRREFAEAYAQSEDDIPDPLAESTVQSATLDWDALTTPQHARRLALTRDLLRARREHVVPILKNLPGGKASARFERGLLTAGWGDELFLIANLSDNPLPRPAVTAATPIWGKPPPDPLPPWSVYAARG